MPAVITGALKNKIDRVWDAFWSGGISNPLEVIEQVTYLSLRSRCDDRALKQRPVVCSRLCSSSHKARHESLMRF